MPKTTTVSQVIRQPENLLWERLSFVAVRAWERPREASFRAHASALQPSLPLLLPSHPIPLSIYFSF